MLHITAVCCLRAGKPVRFLPIFQVHQSSAIVFIDPSSNIEEHNLRSISDNVLWGGVPELFYLARLRLTYKTFFRRARTSRAERL